MQMMKTLIYQFVDFFKTKPMRFFVRFGLVSLIVAAAIAIPVIRAGVEPTGPSNVQVSRGSIIESVDALGIVEAMPSAALAWQSSGIVSSFDLQVGDQVEKGQILLTLDDSSVLPEILQARSSLLEAQIEYQKMLIANTDYLAALQEVNTQELILENTYSMRHAFYGKDTSDVRVNGIYASYTNARVAVWELEDAYEQVKDLDDEEPLKVAAYDELQAGIFKRDSLLRAMNQILGTPYGHRAEGYFILYDQRAAELAQARANTQRLLDHSNVLSAMQANIQALQNTVNQASIIAPFSGTITDIQPAAGGQVKTGDFAVQLEDLSDLIIDVEISQVEINKVYAGQSVLITFDALLNTVYEGTVIETSEAGKASGDDSLFRVRIAILHADEKIKPGFSASVSVITNQVEDVLLVPNAAIHYKADGSEFVIQQVGLNQLIEVPIQTGARSDAYSELSEGDLGEGDDLVVAAANSIDSQIETGDVLRGVRRITIGG
jgi:HlyD family secretion protein